jgi:hypothetical protein
MNGPLARAKLAMSLRWPSWTGAQCPENDDPQLVGTSYAPPVALDQYRYPLDTVGVQVTVCVHVTAPGTVEPEAAHLKGPSVKTVVTPSFTILPT